MRIMFRFKILASTIPLILAGVFARSELFSGTPRCINVGETSVQIASAPWQAKVHLGFTDDPTLATVRVQIVDAADAADFAVVDDIDSVDADACQISAATRFISIAALPSSAEPLIYLSKDGGADYRIYVNSKTFTTQEAAALVVGAGGAGRARLAAASL